MKKIAFILLILVAILAVGFTAYSSSVQTNQSNFIVRDVQVQYNHTPDPIIVNVDLENTGIMGNDTVYIEILNATNHTVLGAKIISH